MCRHDDALHSDRGEALVVVGENAPGGACDMTGGAEYDPIEGDPAVCFVWLE